MADSDISAHPKLKGRNLKPATISSYKWRIKNPSAHKKIVRRYLIKKKYGLSQGDFSALLKAQGGGCAICGNTKPGGRWGEFAVDHCHETGVIRGILCHKCNFALGCFKDSKEMISTVLEYLDRRIDVMDFRKQ